MTDKNKSENKFEFFSEQFADLKIIRYQVPGFDKMSLKQKKLLYYLYQASISGRDILWDQNYKHNILIRKVLENIMENYPGERKSENWKKWEVYTKRVWFSNGIHHHYSMKKIVPDCSKDFFCNLVLATEGFELNKNFKSNKDLCDFLLPIIFDPKVDGKRVCLDHGVDLVESSACNFYDGVSESEATEFYSKMGDSSDKEPISYGLNSKLVKEKGEVFEKVWKVDGLYSPAIEKMVYWFEKAVEVAENENQAKAFRKLMEFYITGDLKTFDEYNKIWLQDTESVVDVINGFIEVYGDPLGKKATFESLVSIRDEEATKRAQTISDNAHWFEWNSPTHKEYKKEEIKGVTAKAIDVVIESGDCSPSTPIGINLPNADWMRAEYGSKSVTISNIVSAYDEVSKNSGALQEFAWDESEVALSKKYATLVSNLHVDLHEIVGHGSGKLKEGVADPSNTLKNYASTLEEARADLVALYYAIDPKLVDLGLMPDIEAGKAEMNAYFRGGLITQLVRVELGHNIEESHMRNRQLIAKWVFEKGASQKIIERQQKDEKTYFVVNDYLKLRNLFGELLAEVQRIKSEGDFEAGKAMVENYGVKVDEEIHKEVLVRFQKLNLAAYAGFINPDYEPVFKDGKIVDVEITYPMDFAEQMLLYSEKYSFLPNMN
ncbi:MAG: dihydrofolate reductase [Bacteroidales bacterium]